ncbi:TIGR02391 family protein [Streptomyces bacillaris]
MDHSYAVAKLTAFIELLDTHQLHMQPASAAPHEVQLAEVLAARIGERYNKGDWIFRSIPSLGDYWTRSRRAAVEALGRAGSEEEVADFLRPDSPSLAAGALHPWVWEPAAPLWAAQAHQDAVLTAARTVNRRLQQKLSRHDIGEMDLCMQSFDLKQPTESKPRLRFDGDRSTPTWRARQEGAKYFSAGAFLGIRNLAAHQEKVTWTEQEALEYLASFSVVARWIEECSVETVPPTVTPAAGTNGA